MRIRQRLKYCTLVTSVLIFTGYLQYCFANPVRNFLIPIGIPVTLNAGDYAVVKIVLATTDPDENGEHETATLWSAGSGTPCAATVTTYFMPSVVQCGPVPANGSMTINSAYVPGPDGDEPGNVDFNINVPKAANKTQKQIDALEEKARDNEVEALAYEGLIKVCQAIQTHTGRTCNLILKYEHIALLDKGAGVLFAMMASDPPDDNYTDIVEPVSEYFEPMVSGNGISQSLVDAINALDTNKQKQYGLLQAAVISLNRASSAQAAGASDWQHIQVLAAAKYAYKLGSVMRAEPGLNQAFQQAIADDGSSFPVISPSTIYSYESEVAYYGLPVTQKALLPVLGIDASTAAQITGLTYVQNINDVANLMSTTDGENLLSNSKLNESLESTADNLQQFALDNGYIPIDCSNANPTVSEIWPPNHKMVNVAIKGIVDDGDLPFDVTITKIQQDEPLDVAGSGAYLIDGEGVGTTAAQLRAERSGGGNGRVYEIGFTATDASGAACSAHVLVTVPHDQSHPALDNGQRYDSTGQ